MAESRRLTYDFFKNLWCIPKYSLGIKMLNLVSKEHFDFFKKNLNFDLCSRIRTKYLRCHVSLSFVRICFKCLMKILLYFVAKNYKVY